MIRYQGIKNIFALRFMPFSFPFITATAIHIVVFYGNYFLFFLFAKEKKSWIILTNLLSLSFPLPTTTIIPSGASSSASYIYWDL